MNSRVIRALQYFTLYKGPADISLKDKLFRLLYGGVLSNLFRVYIMGKFQVRNLKSKHMI